LEGCHEGDERGKALIRAIFNGTSSRSSTATDGSYGSYGSYGQPQQQPTIDAEIDFAEYRDGQPSDGVYLADL
jgi:hypothetical protein